ncbi:hypothetical protein ABIF91_000310 [Bradyrhizobium sp. USDA 241]
MSGNLTQFGEDLRPHLLRLQASLNNINGLFACCPPTDDAQCAEQLENLRALAIESCARAGKLRETLEAGLARDAVCQSAFDWDPLSASKRDPFDRRALLVALGSSELVGVAETARARVV